MEHKTQSFFFYNCQVTFTDMAGSSLVLQRSPILNEHALRYLLSRKLDLSFLQL